jgi:hypothetical protein
MDKYMTEQDRKAPIYSKVGQAKYRIREGVQYFLEAVR